MSAARADDQAETTTHRIECASDGCTAFVIGVERASKVNAPAKAAIKARREAIEAGWDQQGVGPRKRWKCPVCHAREVKEMQEADLADRTTGAQRRMMIRASRAAREAVERRQAERDKQERRKTRAVGDKIAKADSTLTKETPKLVFTCEFERVVMRHLQPRQITAADEWRRQLEASEGVSDREVFSDRVDKSVSPGHPSLTQLAALQWRANVQTHIGQENAVILDKAIKHDMTPREVGADYCTTKDLEKRAMVGMAFIKAALTQLADYMKLRR